MNLLCSDQPPISLLLRPQLFCVVLMGRKNADCRIGAAIHPAEGLKNVILVLSTAHDCKVILLDPGTDHCSAEHFGLGIPVRTVAFNRERVSGAQSAVDVE